MKMLLGATKSQSTEKPAKENSLAKRNDGFWYTNRYVFLAFFVPFLLMLYAFAQGGLYPFGTNQVMVIDMWHQYFPFLKVLQGKLTSFDSLLYSWDTGMGTNFLNLMAYYASSPLNLLTIFFPEAYLREAMALIILLKIGFAGSFFAIYLRGICKKCDLGTVAFSTLYALCAYAMGYYWCLMWLDVMALLPLVILGMHRLVEEGKYRLFVISLGVAIIANYYIAMMMCIFVFFYYFVLYFAKKRIKNNRGLIYILLGWIAGAILGGICGISYSFAKGDGISSETFGSSLLTWMIGGLLLGTVAAIVMYFAVPGERNRRDFLMTSLKMGISSLGGAALSAVLLLPTWYGMQTAYAMSNTAPTAVSVYNPILDVFNHLLTGTNPTVRGGMPNIACGMIAVMLAVLFLVNRSISLREKVLNTVLLIFLFLSMNINVLDFYWHGTHFPNELPYRFSFVFSFVLLTMAYRCYVKLEGITARQIGLVMGAGVVYLAVVQKLYEDLTWQVIYTSGLFIILYGLVLLFHKRAVAFRALAGVLIFCVVLAESAVISSTGVQAVGSSDRESYTDSMVEIEDFLEQYEDGDPEFFRTELNDRWTCNPSALYGYKGISQFSSAANANVTLLLEHLGIGASQAGNRYLYNLNTTLLSSMLNLRYIVTRNDVLTDDTLKMVYQKEVEGTSKYVYAYENKYYLPIAFVTDDLLSNWKSSIGSNPFIVQNSFATYATGEDVEIYQQLLPRGAADTSGVTITGNSQTDINYSTNSSGNGSIDLTYVPNSRKNVYVYVDARNTESVRASATNGMSASGESSYPGIMSLGTCQQGDTVTVSIRTKEGVSGKATVYVYTMDDSEMNRVYNILKRGGLRVTDYSSTHINGTVNAQNDGLLYTSIPYEKGWSVKIDGVEQEVTPIENAFVAVPITAGSHTVEFRYTPQGFVPGLFISLVTILILVALYLMEKKGITMTMVATAIKDHILPAKTKSAKEDSEPDSETTNTEEKTGDTKSESLSAEDEWPIEEAIGTENGKPADESESIEDAESITAQSEEPPAE